MTAFAILGSSGHAFSNGIVTFGLMASSSGLVIPLTIFLIGTRVWALGKKYGFMTPVQMFRDRWECTHIGTVIFAVQAAALAAMAVTTAPAALYAGSVAFGLGVGNVITLPPLLAHAEFGARSFAVVFGMASAAMQIGVAFGPGIVGVLRDLTGGYGVAVGVLATFDAAAVAGVLWGRHAPPRFDSPTSTR